MTLPSWARWDTVAATPDSFTGSTRSCLTHKVISIPERWTPENASRNLFCNTKFRIRAKSTLSLERRLPQPRCVGNHGDGAEAHRRAGQHGAEQPTENRIENARRDRNSDHIVEKRERQILLDVSNRGAAEFSCPHDSPQVAFQQSDTRVFNRYVRPRAHRNAHVRSRQCQRVVNSITRHRNNVAFSVQLLDDLAFFLRSDLCLDFFNLQLRGYGLCRFRAISSEHHHSHALCFQLLDRSGG